MYPFAFKPVISETDNPHDISTLNAECVLLGSQTSASQLWVDTRALL